MRLVNLCKLPLFVTLQWLFPVPVDGAQDVLSNGPGRARASVAFSSEWSVLGPFRLGTREAIWGADPIEYYGGIQHVNDKDHHCFHSPLTNNATVQWSQRKFKTRELESGCSIDLAIDFAEVDWEFAQKFYGWSAFQFQGWSKGTLSNHDSVSRTITLSTTNILELWIDDFHVFGGDFFGFQRAPIVVDLRPGVSYVSVRLLREVRSMGGIFPPTLQASLQAVVVSEPLEVADNGHVLPDVVDGLFCSRYGSVTVRNQGDSWIEVRHIAAVLSGNSQLLTSESTHLAPGQSRPIKLILGFSDQLKQHIDLILVFSLTDASTYEKRIRIPLRHVDGSSVQKFTFLHPSGAVSYALLRPPTTAESHQIIPILLNLHGAGVEADGPLARHMFDDTPDLTAWIVSPTGMSPWSSDDWHNWGFADAIAAVSAIPDWIGQTSWKGPSAYLHRLLVAGHSNGGQGTWFFASHQPDRILGAAAASGYSSIENYVPYVYWNEADPLQSAVLGISRANFRHELLVENLVGLPILQQHGSADDNVPAYHSRLMNTLLAEVGESADYSEMEGKGHWFDGSMTTSPMRDFYLRCLNTSHAEHSAPSGFTFVVPNSHEVASRYGIFVDQLLSPDRFGRIRVVTEVDRGRRHWHLRTENIRRLHFDPSPHLDNAPDAIFLDDLPHAFRLTTRKQTFIKTESNLWGRDVALNWRNLDQRYGRQRGVLDSILRSHDTFEIVHCSDLTLALAVQSSRNFLQYFGADSNILPLSRYGEALAKTGNVITICLGRSVPRSQLPTFPIQLDEERISLTRRDGNELSIPLNAGMGGVWLRPLRDERLELVVWGYDEAGLQQAARLIPTLTGAGQPDFVILGQQVRWAGSSGAIALGLLDYNWRVSAASYLPT